jgi:two-component sensor histidine kinase
LQANHIKQPEYNSILLDSQNRVQSMALIHEKLYQSSNLADIDFTSYLESLVSHLHRSYNPAQKEISVKVKASPIQLGIDHAVPCGLIINEFVSNALKHGFPNQSQGEIIVEAELEAENTLRLSVRDNGKGLPAGLDIENSNSLGLRLVQALVGQLNGSLSLDTSQGTCFSVTFTAA